MSLYAIKDEDGDLRDTAWDSPNITGEFYAYTDVSVDDATREAAKHRDSRVVELVEKAEPIAIPQWFDEWIQKYEDNVENEEQARLRIIGKICQSGWGIDFNDQLNAEVIDQWNPFNLDNCQLDYIHDHKDELVHALSLNSWTVKQPQRWYVKTPKEWDSASGRQRFYKRSDSSIGQALESLAENTADEQFTAEEIDKYQLGGFETVEVED